MGTAIVERIPWGEQSLFRALSFALKLSNFLEQLARGRALFSCQQEL